MKFRNLLLATAACAGLFTACSNEINEAVDNNTINGQKEAFMQVGFAFPSQGMSARALTVEDGKTEEQTFGELLLVITDKDGKITDSEVLGKEKFSPDGSTGGQPGTDGKKFYVSGTPIKVTKQEGAKVYVIVNPTTTIKEKFTVGQNLKGTEALEGVTEQTGGIANNNAFLMTNETNGEVSGVVVDINGTATNPTKVSVSVNRVSAKLVESSKSDPFEITEVYKNEKGDTYTLNITLEKYTYTNLNKTSYLFEQKGDNYTKDFNFDREALEGDFFYQNTTFDDTKYKFQPISANKVDYCLENTVTATKQFTNNTTGIIYKAVAKWNGSTEAKTFYKYEGKIHLDWASLKATYEEVGGKTLNNEDSYSIEDLAKMFITKYKDGVNYYRTTIKHIPSDTNLAPMEFAIVRNNVYKLHVNSIKGLGEPIIPTNPDPSETDKASLELTVEVLPWTVRDNSFDF